MHTVEKEFEHNGYRCVVIMTEMGHRCGYVAVPEGHALFGVDYSENIFPSTLIENEPIGDRGIIPMLCSAGDMISLDVLIDVHGSITFSRGSHYGVPDRSLDFLKIEAEQETPGSLYARELERTIENKGKPTDYPVPSQTPVWWFGFDCAHAGDNPITCDTEYVTKHCVKLADQLEKYE